MASYELIFIADLRGAQGVPGPQGADGLPASATLPADDAVAAYLATIGASATKTAAMSLIYKLLPAVDATSHGVLGNGTDESVAIQALFDTYAGRVIYFPPGTYRCVNPAPKTGSTVYGVRGMTKFELIGNGLSNGMARMKLYDVNNVTLRDFSIGEVNVTGRTGTFGCISSSGAANILIDGVEVTSGSGTGMHFMSTDNLKIINCTVRNTQADGIHMQRGMSNVFIDSCRVYDNGDDAIGFVSHAQATAGYCTDLTVNNCILGPTKTDYIGAGIALIGCIGATITGNTIKGTASGGIRITSIGEGSAGFAVVGNIVITGNRITDVGFYAGAVSGQLSSGIDIFNARNVLIASNIVDKAFKNGITVSQCSIDVSIKGNEIRRPGSRGIFVATLRQVDLYLQMWTNPAFADGRSRAYVSHHNLTISDNQINAPGLGGITAQGADATTVIEGLTLLHNVIRSPNQTNVPGSIGVLLSYVKGLFSTLNDVGAAGGSTPIVDYNTSNLTAITLNASNYSTPVF